MGMWRRILLAAFAVALAIGGEVYAATMAESVDDAAVDMAAAYGGSAADFHVVLGESSGNTFIPAANAALAPGGPAPAAVTNGLTAIISAPATASANDVLAGLNIANGVATALPAAQIGSVMSQAIGGSGGVISTRQEALFAERRDMVDSFGNDSALASYQMNCDLANRIWASPFGTWQSGDRNKMNEGYTFDAYGVSLGYDRAFGNLTLGGAFTYSKGDYDVDHVEDDNTIDSYGFSAYGQYYSPETGFFVTLAGGYTYSDNDWNRREAINAAWQRGGNHTDSYWIGGNFGKDFTFAANSCDKVILTPSIGLFWSESKGSGYTSTGVIEQLVGTTKMQSLMMPVDAAVRYTHDLGNDTSITLKAHGGYAYNFHTDGADGSMRYDYVGSNVINVYGADQERHSWNAGAGVTYRFNQFDIGVDYRYDGNKHVNAHRVSATFGVNF